MVICWPLCLYASLFERAWKQVWRYFGKAPAGRRLGSFSQRGWGPLGLWSQTASASRPAGRRGWGGSRVPNWRAEEASPRCESRGRVGVRAGSPASPRVWEPKRSAPHSATSVSAPPADFPRWGLNARRRRGASRWTRTDFLGGSRLLALASACSALCLAGGRAGRSPRDGTPTPEIPEWAHTPAGIRVRAVRGWTSPVSPTGPWDSVRTQRRAQGGGTDHLLRTLSP